MNTLEKSPIAKKSAGRPSTKIASVENGDEEEIKVDLGFDIDPTKFYLFEVIKKVDAHRIENLGARGRVYDPNQKRYREIRYVKMAPTIFVEEQHESFDEYPDPPVMFNRNMLAVSGSDTRLMEYMMMHELCDGSPFRLSNKPPMYRLVDKEAEDTIKAQKIAKEMQAMKVVESTPISDLSPVARIIFGITETTETAIRNALYDLVKKEKKGLEKSNAEKVLENIDNPKLIRKNAIQSAIDNGIIFTNRDTMQCKFSDGVFICQLTSVNPDPILNELTNWSFSDAGQKWYTELRKRI